MTSRFIPWLAALLLVVVAGTTVAEEAALETEDDRIFYAFGMMIASRLPKIQPTPDEMEMIMLGLREGLEGKEPRVVMPDYAKKLDSFLQQRMVKLSEAEMEAGTQFREEMAQQAGAVRSDTGVIYLEVEAGSGAQPTAGDSVKVHYRGTLRDGKVFDDSIARGQPATIPLDKVVPCFAEGLKKMKVGGKAKLVCPPEQAYGNRGSPGIPPGATLVFEVELIEIVPAEPAGETE